MGLDKDAAGLTSYSSSGTIALHVVPPGSQMQCHGAIKLERALLGVEFSLTLFTLYIFKGTRLKKISTLYSQPPSFSPALEFVLGPILGGATLTQTEFFLSQESPWFLHVNRFLARATVCHPAQKCQLPRVNIDLSKTHFYLRGLLPRYQESHFQNSSPVAAMMMIMTMTNISHISGPSVSTLNTLLYLIL